MSSSMHQANQRYWDQLSSRWKELRDQDQLWRICPQNPGAAFNGEALAFIQKYLGDIQGRETLVIGSGDNYTAFALAGLGARVTSSDISQNQLDIASERAKIINLSIVFIRADAVDLGFFSENQYNLVTSSNGFLTWISDLRKVFSEVHRVLKPGGFFIFYDIHPFLRPWKNQITPLEMEKPYSDTGPYRYEENGMTSYEFHWRMSDIINPLLESGLVLREIAETTATDAAFWEGYAYTPGINPNLLEWRENPRAGLPAWLTIAAQKPD